MFYFTTALICLNGHVIAYDVDELEHKDSFCSQCGAPTISTCPSCGAPIKGCYVDELKVSTRMSPCEPLHCHQCGKPFPWMQAELDEIETLIAMSDDLTSEEKNQLHTLFPNLFIETPHTVSSAITAARLLTKLSPLLKDALKASVSDKIVANALKFLGW